MGNQVSDGENKAGKSYISKRDEEICCAWPRALRTFAPRRTGIPTWTTRTCWRAGTGTRCEDLLTPDWCSCGGYDGIGRHGMMHSDHDMIVARLGGMDGPRSWRPR